MGIRTKANIRIQKRSAVSSNSIKPNPFVVSTTISPNALDLFRDQYLDSMFTKLEKNIREYQQYTVNYAPKFEDFVEYGNQMANDTMKFLKTFYPEAIAKRDENAMIESGHEVEYTVPLRGSSNLYLHIVMEPKNMESDEIKLNYGRSRPLIFYVNNYSRPTSVLSYMNNDGLMLALGSNEGQKRASLVLNAPVIQSNLNNFSIEKAQKIMELIKLITTCSKHDEKELGRYWRRFRI